MATFSDDFYDADDFEIPCEFCEELFPVNLLIEHQTGCRPDLVHFQTQDDEPVSKTQPVQVQMTGSVKSQTNDILGALLQKDVIDLFDPLKEVRIVDDKLLQNETSIVKETPQLNTLFKQNDAEISIKEKEIKKDLRSRSIIKDILASEEPNLSFEDSIMQDKGPKLMAYGSSLSKNKIEEEKPSFKIPSLPHLDNADHVESENVCNNLSDSDDAGESLEDFWKKAEIQLSRRFLK